MLYIMTFTFVLNMIQYKIILLSLFTRSDYILLWPNQSHQGKSLLRNRTNRPSSESTIRSTSLVRMDMGADAKLTKINKRHNSRSTVTNGSIRDWNRSNGGRWCRGGRACGNRGGGMQYVRARVANNLTSQARGDATRAFPEN